MCGNSLPGYPIPYQLTPFLIMISYPRYNGAEIGVALSVVDAVNFAIRDAAEPKEPDHPLELEQQTLATFQNFKKNLMSLFPRIPPS